MLIISMKRITEIFLLIFFVSNLFATSNQQKIEFDIKTSKQGLSDNDISSIVEDGHGFLWLGTNEGLNRYDGYEFKTYQSNYFDSTALSGNVIWHIFKDMDGDIWVGTDKGVDQYIYGMDEFIRYDIGSQPTFITQDTTDGTIWVTSKNTGLHSIDKKNISKRSFINDPDDGFSISSNSFDVSQSNPIVIDVLGNIWVGTNNGLNYYRKDKDIFTRFNKREGLSDDKINALMSKGDFVYVGTSKGLEKINIKSFNIEKISGSAWFSFTGLYGVNKIIKFSNDQGFWMATTGGLVYATDIYGEDIYNDVEWFGLFGQWINDINLDLNGNLWIDVNSFTGLIRLETEQIISYGMSDNDDFYRIFLPDENGILKEVTGDYNDKFSAVNTNLPGKQIRNWHQDELGNIWVGTQMGLNQALKTTQNFSFINQSGQIKGNNIFSVNFDKDGFLWIAHENGLDKLSPNLKLIKSYNSDPTNPNSLLTSEIGNVIVYNDQVWAAGEYRGLTIIDKKKNKFYRFNGINNNKTFASRDEYISYLTNELLDGNKKILDDIEDQALIGSVNSKISAINENLIKRPKKPSPLSLSGKIKSIYQDGDLIWLAVKNGVAVYDTKMGSIFDFDIYINSIYPEKEFLNDPTVLLRDSISNDLWIGTESNGLFRVDSKDMKILENYTVDKNDEKSFTSIRVKSIHQTKNGDIWIGSGGEGLYKFNRSENNFDKWTTEEGLPSNTILSISSNSSDGSIWVSSRRGISRLLSSGRVQSFDMTDGLPASEFNERSIALDKNGKIYFGSISGLAYVNPTSVVTNQNPPLLAISSIEAIGHDGSKNKVSFLNNQLSVKDREVRTINLNFVGLTYNKNEKNQYQYRIKNYIDEWQSLGSSRFLPFQPPSKGKYTFQFKASNNDGVWNNEPYEISIVVIPPFWNTTSAYVFYLISLIGIGAFGFVAIEKFRAKVRENRRKDQELAEARDFQLKMIAKEIPDYQGMNIKAYMRTSTEVGGDYYDFFELEDGSFYVVCGDATGHGSQSGMMVSITKAGLAGIDSDSPKEILYRLNNVVRRVNTGRLRMSLSVCIFRDNKLFISAAAMPPAYLYSGKNKTVEEIEIHNLPLGGLANEDFDLVERGFEKGDVLVLLSDGLPEAPDPGGKLLDYQAVFDCIEKTGHLGASPVKEALIKLADEWLDGTQNPDDITFVVLEKDDSVDTPKKLTGKQTETVPKVAQA